MTQIAHVELLLRQYLALSEEINNLISQEEFEDAVALSENKNELIQKLHKAQKTVNFKDTEMEKLNLILKQISNNEKRLIESLNKTKVKLGYELKVNKKKFKLATAYSVNTENNHGAIINVLE